MCRVVNGWGRDIKIDGAIIEVRGVRADMG
jgi:hypothetical protein